MTSRRENERVLGLLEKSRDHIDNSRVRTVMKFLIVLAALIAAWHHSLGWLVFIAVIAFLVESKIEFY